MALRERLIGNTGTPGVGSDTSVTGWMMMALKSGELAGLTVPGDTYSNIDKWLTRPDGPQAPSGERPGHRPASLTAPARIPTASIAAAALATPSRPWISRAIAAIRAGKGPSSRRSIAPASSAS